MRFSLILIVLLVASLFMTGCGSTESEEHNIRAEVEPVTGNQVETAVDNLLVDETDDVELGELI